MPELPEVEHLRRQLVRSVVGRRIRSVDIRRDDIIARGGQVASEASDARGSSRCGAASAVSLLTARTIVGLGRHGKLLLIRTALSADCGSAGQSEDDQWLLVHLGMSGQLLLAHREADLLRRDHVHAVFQLAGTPPIKRTGKSSIESPINPALKPMIMAFRDPRRFGGIMVVSGANGMPLPWCEYGVDALTGDRPKLHTVNSPISALLPHSVYASQCGGGQRPIKAVLLDQRRIAGIGNIYADEILHKAGVHPLTPIDRIRPAAWTRLAEATTAILFAAIDAGGSTIRDYIDSASEPGRYGQQHAVYGRAGQPCRRCGRTLASTIVAGRSSVFCSRCQRSPRQGRM